MPVEIEKLSMGRVQATTIDRYGNTETYEFKLRYGIAVPIGDSRPYTPVVLQALWNNGIPVEWNPDDLTPQERKELDGFCDACGSQQRQTQLDADSWKTWCPKCEGKPELTS